MDVNSRQVIPTPAAAAPRPTSSGRTPATRAPARCVLIVDRPSAEIDHLEAMLRMAGAGLLRVFADGQRAARSCLEAPPDLVVIDLDTQRTDGLDALAVLRDALPRQRFLPIVALTSDTSVHARVIAFAAGANDHFAGPVDELAFVERVHNLLTMRALFLHVQARNLALGAESPA